MRQGHRAGWAGKGNKLLLPYRGAALITHAVRTAISSRADLVIVVTGHQQDEVRAALWGMNVPFANADSHEEGMSRSLQAGLAALPEEIDGAIIMLADMPLVQTATEDCLIEAFDPWADASICIPVHDGKRGNPILLAREFFGKIMELEGDMDARGILADHSEQIVEVPVDDAGVLRDFDTTEDLQRND